MYIFKTQRGCRLKIVSTYVHRYAQLQLCLDYDSASFSSLFANRSIFKESVLHKNLALHNSDTCKPQLNKYISLHKDGYNSCIQVFLHSFFLLTLSFQCHAVCDIVGHVGPMKRLN
jgi:hypothetical protein